MNKSPGVDNSYYVDHVADMVRSFSKLTNRNFPLNNENPQDLAREIFYADFALVSHGTESDPIFNYANMKALSLWEMTWEQFTALPSRNSAELPNQLERQRMLKQVTEQGYIDDYSGVRISSQGKRFLIEQAVVWNIDNLSGNPSGQAAMFSQWQLLRG